MNCSYRTKNGKTCNNLVITGSKYCSNESHYPSKKEFQELLLKKQNEFISERESTKNYIVKDVKGDGACLFRCLSNALFILSGNDLFKVKEIIDKTGYFNYPNFLKEYLDIAECLMTDDYELDEDVEEEIARGIQSTIVNYVRSNSKLKIMDEMTLEDLILFCHEIDIETYLKNYERFAGENDFLIEKITTDNGKIRIKKVEIDDRWGGIPELKVFCLLFNFNLIIYGTQKFNIKTMKPENTSKINNETYFKIIDKIESGKEDSIPFNLLLREFKIGSHYDYLIKK